MFREGELTVRLGIQANRIRSVDIASTRTPLPARLTQGRPVEDVERTIPLLFSICARAQGAAASSALAAARGIGMDPEAARATQRRRAAGSDRRAADTPADRLAKGARNPPRRHRCRASPPGTARVAARRLPRDQPSARLRNGALRLAGGNDNRSSRALDCRRHFPARAPAAAAAERSAGPWPQRRRKDAQRQCRRREPHRACHLAPTSASAGRPTGWAIRSRPALLRGRPVTR